MKRIRFLIVTLVCCLVAPLALAEPEGGIAVRLVPGSGFPVGANSPDDGLDRFSNLDLVYSLFQFPALTLAGGVSYGRIPLAPDGSDVAGRLLGRAELAFVFQSSERLDMSCFATGGAYRLFSQDSEHDGRVAASAGGGIRVTQQVTPALSLVLELGYARQYDLYNVVTFGGGAEVRVLRPRALALEGGEVASLFPALYQHYAARPIGRVTLTNRGPTPLENIELSLMADGYMDQPTPCGGVAYLEPGTSRTLDLHGLFSRRILTITEDTRIPLLVQARYTANGRERVAEQTIGAVAYNRNAISWQDDRRAAAFVSPRDPEILRFARGAVAAAPDPVQAVDPAIQNALAIHTALGLAGLKYVVDPESPYSELSRAEGAIDFLQFASQTFEYGAGDCDDLVILYCSLLEAAGIETAFITTPGHIHLAFALSSSRGETPVGGSVVSRDGRQWVPLETTLVGESFLRAWNAGSELLDGHADTAGFFPVRAAQGIYPPAEYRRAGQGGDPAAGPDLAEAVKREWQRFVDVQIHRTVESLEARIPRSNRPEAEWNRLGVLYARYGMVEEARAAFRSATVQGSSADAQGSYAPALYNLGNLAYSEGDWSDALEYYLRAEQARPDSPYTLLQLERVWREIGENERAAEVRARLQQVAPEFAVSESPSRDDSSSGRSALTAAELVWEE